MQAPFGRKLWLVALPVLFMAGAVALARWGYVTAVREVDNDYAHWTTANIEQSLQFGSQIVRDIQAFHAQRGRYPVDLKELAGHSGNDYPSPVAGNSDWGYQAEGDGQSYAVWFSANEDEYPVAYYESA